MCSRSWLGALWVLGLPLAMAQDARPGPAPASPPRVVVDPVASPSYAANTATTTTTLSLPQAVEIALARHPLLAAADHRLQARQADRLQAGAWPNPTLEFELEDTRHNSRNTRIVLSQALELGGQRAARVDAAQAASMIVASQRAQQAHALRAEVASAFALALVEQERVRLADASRQTAQHHAEAVGRRIEAGKLAPIEATRAAVAHQQAVIGLQAAQGQHRLARSRLAAAMGGYAMQGVELEGRLDPLPPPIEDEALARRLEASPAMRQARWAMDEARALTRLEQARRVPELAVSVGTLRDAEAGRTKAIVGLSIPLPLFDRNQGALLAALRHEDERREVAHADALMLRARAAELQERQRSLRAQLALLDARVLPAARESLEAANAGFGLGRFGSLDVLDAQRSLATAQRERLDTLAQAWQAIAELEPLLGDASLDDPSRNDLALDEPPSRLQRLTGAQP